MDFARVLLVGIVIFSVLLIFFGGDFAGFDLEDDGGPSYEFGPVDEPENDTEVAEGDITDSFFVGRENETDYKYFTLSKNSFEVSFDDRVSSFGEIEETEIKRGFLVDEKRRITFNLTEGQRERLRSMEVSFSVDDTNSLGKLMVELNGKKIFSKYLKPGERNSMDINTSLLDKRNELKVYAESSGTTFWAPTVYILDNFTVEANILGRDTKNFVFSLNEKQADNFEKGRIVLYPEEVKGESPLVIQVNGKDIYRNRMEMPGTSSVWIEYENTEVKEGDNKLTFFTDYNSSYNFRKGNMVVFWGTQTKRTTSKAVDVSSGQRSRLPGEMSFEIDRIEGSPTSLSIEIVKPSGETEKLIVQEVLREGKTISIDLTKDDLEVGGNDINFMVEGSGGFYLSNFEIDY